MSSDVYISHEVLSKLDKILIISHMALGDFTYMQQFFKKLHKEYPSLKVDILIDDVRRTRLFWRWKHIKRYALYEWLEECLFFNKRYTSTYSPKALNETLKLARSQDYKVVISLCTLRPKMHAKWARYISPRGYVVGIEGGGPLDVEVSNKVDKQPWHVTDLYASWFKQIFGIELDNQEKIPRVEIPTKWAGYGAKFIPKSDKKTIFINSFAKNKKRCWPVEKVAKLIDELGDYNYIVNAPPSEVDKVRSILGDNVLLLEAGDNFFQIPSVISQCDYVISVETSIMHLAAALNVPCLSLMRTKNPEWVPFGVGASKIAFAPTRKAWVCDIPTTKVVNGFNDLLNAI